MRESKNFCASYLTKISTDLNGIAETCWCDEPSIFNEENPACVISLKKKKKKN